MKTTEKLGASVMTTKQNVMDDFEDAKVLDSLAKLDDALDHLERVLDAVEGRCENNKKLSDLSS